jgi:hypothetical protein
MSDIAEIVSDPEVQRHLAAASPEYRLAWAWRMSWFATQHPLASGCTYLG